MSGLRVGVIDLGYFGERHARIYRGRNHVDLVAVCDRDAGRAAKLAAELGAESYTDFRALLARPDIDAVSICMPDREHTDDGLVFVDRRVRQQHVAPVAGPVEHDRLDDLRLAGDGPFQAALASSQWSGSSRSKSVTPSRSAVLRPVSSAIARLYQIRFPAPSSRLIAS